jgi:hypothetical protein
MGNQMFQYAAGRALALRNEVPLKLDLVHLLDRTPRPKNRSIVFRNYDLDIFRIEAEVARRVDVPMVFREYLSGRAKLYLAALRRRVITNRGRERSFAFDPAILGLGPSAYLEGYWQSPKYFDSVADRIRCEFTLRDPMSVGARELAEEIRACSSVCINVRRTDFVTSGMHGTFGKEYYDRGLAVVAERTKIDRIFVFSDDVKWCEANLAFEYPMQVVGHDFAGPKFGEYLNLMAACRHFIIPNSSFAWWAAWLNTDPAKTVVAPKRWFLDESIHTGDLFPIGWIRI